MAHALANDSNRKIHITRYARPGVPGHIGGQPYSQPRPLADNPQGSVHILVHPPVLLVLGSVFGPDDGQQVGGVLGKVGIAVYDGLQSLFLGYRQVLVGLLTAVL